jgi:NIPSNAP
VRYELATLTIKIGSVAAVTAGIDAFVKEPAAKGQFLGCWMSDIGELNKVFVLRGFDDGATLAAERARVSATTNPFNCGDALTALEMDAYAPFPWLPPVASGNLGPVYEIRSYKLKNGGLPATLASWEKALPARSKLSNVLIAMYTLDGPARFTHIWPYPSLDARASIRSSAISQGVWPPKGGPEWLGEMRSTIALPLACSPLK